MPTEDKKSGFSESGGDVMCVVSMTKSSSYMSSASSSSYSTSNTCDGEYSQPLNPTTTSSNTPASSMTVAAASCLVNRYNSVESGGDGQTTPAVHREPHRVKFAEDRNEYLTSSDPEYDQTDSSYDGRRSHATSTGRWCEGGDDITGANWSYGDRGTVATAHRPIIKAPPSARPRSPENHENPFITDGELYNKADYIIRNSTISRLRIRIADPDCTPPQPSTSSTAAMNHGADLCTTGNGDDDDGDYDDDFRWRESSHGDESDATAVSDVIITAPMSTRLDTEPKQWDTSDRSSRDGRVRLLNSSPPASLSFSGVDSRSNSRVNGLKDHSDSANDDDDLTVDGRLDVGQSELSHPATVALLVGERRASDGCRLSKAGSLGLSEVSEQPSSAGRRRHCCQVQ